MLTGVDLSRWQTITDYGALASAVDFAVLKLGGSNAGTYVSDAYYAQANGLAGRGVPVGSYWMNGGGDPASDARFFLDHLHGDADDFLVLDLEHIDGHRAWTPAQALAWFETVRSARPGVELWAYMNASLARAHDWSGVEAAGVRLWLASYGADDGTLAGAGRAVTYGGSGITWSTWHMRQYTQHGTVPGIAGGVDLNIAFSDPSHRPVFTEAAARDWVAHGSQQGRGWLNMCQALVWRLCEAFGEVRQDYDPALAAYAASEIVSMDPAAAPIGAIHYWLQPTDYGHVAVSLGGGRCIMASADVDELLGDHVGIVGVDGYTARKRVTYLGWSRTNGLNSIRTTLSKAPATTPLEDEMHIIRLLDNGQHYLISSDGHAVLSDEEAAALMTITGRPATPMWFGHFFAAATAIHRAYTANDRDMQTLLDQLKAEFGGE